MHVLYSIGARLAGGGIGNTAYHGAAGLWRHQLLRKVYCGSAASTDIPAKLIAQWGWRSRILRKLAVYDRTNISLAIHNQQFDCWVEQHLPEHSLLLFWNGFGLRSMQAAKKKGMITIVQRASSHPAYQARLLREEYARWGGTFSQSKKLLSRSIREVEEADYVLIPSQFVRQSCLEEGIAEEKLIEIPFGIDAGQFKPGDNLSKNAPFRVLFVGQLSFRKGILYLLQAWQKLQWRDAELWLLGRVSAEIRPFLKPYHQDPSIHFLDYTPNPAQLYQQADIFVFPSVEEGSALVTYEAMASGLPTITTHNAGSLVRHGQDGFLVTIRDVNKLAEYMEILRQDADLRRQMGQSARNYIEKYPWKRHGDRLAAAVSDLLAPSPV